MKNIFRWISDFRRWHRASERASKRVRLKNCTIQFHMAQTHTHTHMNSNWTKLKNKHFFSFFAVFSLLLWLFGGIEILTTYLYNSLLKWTFLKWTLCRTNTIWEKFNSKTFAIKTKKKLRLAQFLFDCCWLHWQKSFMQFVWPYFVPIRAIEASPRRFISVWQTCFFFRCCFICQMNYAKLHHMTDHSLNVTSGVHLSMCVSVLWLHYNN